MKNTCLVLFLVLFRFSASAEYEIDHIEFHLTHALRIPHAHVVIVFNAQGESIRCHVTSKIRAGSKGDWKKTEIDTSFSFADSSFRNLQSSIALLDYNTLKSQEDEEGLDGYTCALSYGNRFALTSYTIWLPTLDTEKRGLLRFLETCRLLIQSAGLKPEEIL